MPGQVTELITIFLVLQIYKSSKYTNQLIRVVGGLIDH